MYQLNLNEQEYKLVEEIICNAFNSLTAKAKIVDLGKMLKETIPVPAELAKEMEEATNDFDKKYEIVSAIHDRIHDLQPVEFKSAIKEDNYSPGLATDNDSIINISETPTPFIAKNVSIKPTYSPDLSSVPHPTLDAGNIAKEPEYVLRLYGTDKRKLTDVFGMLSSYHTTLNLTMRDDVNHNSNSRDVREARDYIWTLIESMK